MSGPSSSNDQIAIAISKIELHAFLVYTSMLLGGVQACFVILRPWAAFEAEIDRDTCGKCPCVCLFTDWSVGRNSLLRNEYFFSQPPA